MALERYVRGQRMYYGDTSLVVLGGPTTFLDLQYYTVIATNDYYLSLGGFGVMMTVEQGKTSVIQGAVMQATMKQGEVWTEAEIQYFIRYYPGTKYDEVIIQDCPNCDNEEMIFYSEDYMCAWCREILEEGFAVE